MTQYEGDDLGNGNFGFYNHSGMQFTTYDQERSLLSLQLCRRPRWCLVVQLVLLGVSHVQKRDERVVVVAGSLCC